MTTISCCAECGKEGGVSLKACISNAKYQRNQHKKPCKHRAAELHNEALFKDPQPKEDCPICFLPMPPKLISCISLPPAFISSVINISSVPIYDFAIAHKELAKVDTEEYYECCGKSICRGCGYSVICIRQNSICPFCNSDRGDKTDEERQIGEMMKRVEANDAGAMDTLATDYYHGVSGLRQGREKAMDLFTKAAKLGSSEAHCNLAIHYDTGGDIKRAIFHYEVAAMVGHVVARRSLGNLELKSGNNERAVKHWMIAASAGDYKAMCNLLVALRKGMVSRESIDSILTAYNKSCAEMRSEARDACIHAIIETNT